MKKIPSLNGLRALSILIVIFYHLLINKKILFSNTLISKIIFSIIDGQFGVNIFFVISGFLITSLMQRENQTNNFSLKFFYLRRGLRIFPAYYFYLFIYSIYS